MVKKFYITTAIDYVNAEPHIGHAFEKTIADAISRCHKLKGEDVFFLTGVDENAQKNVQAAEKARIPIKQFVDNNTSLFLKLCKNLEISYSDFIRTSAKDHALVVQKIIKQIIKKKDIYKSEYTGYYCTGCEAFITEKDLINGKCPEHNKEPEYRKEEAYFFKLSKYQKKLLKIIPKYVIPTSKKNEILVRVKEGLQDLCITRRNADIGVDFPEDKGYKVYVWVDALINYISGLKDKEKKYWPADVHIIGKGINWFHSVIWPAILLSAGYKLPKKLLVHGYINLEGVKMSKSLGNVISPLKLLEKYDADIIRYALLKCSVFEDSDFSEEVIVERNNNELANKLGNLVSRVSALAETHGLQKTSNKLIKKLKLKEIEKLLENYEIDKALNEIFAFIDVCNEYVQENKPWETHDKKVLYELADSIKAISILLWPFIPSSCEKIAKTFGFEIKNLKDIKKLIKINKIKKAEILFNKIEFKEKKEIEGIINMENIKFQAWEKLDLRVGKIVKVEDIDEADKLYKLEVDLGKELGKRTLVAGLKQYYKKEDLKNKLIIVFCNLEPRNMRGIESKGMLLAAVNKDRSKVILLSPEKDIELGSRIS